MITTASGLWALGARRTASAVPSNDCRQRRQASSTGTTDNAQRTGTFVVKIQALTGLTVRVLPWREVLNRREHARNALEVKFDAPEAARGERHGLHRAAGAGVLRLGVRAGPRRGGGGAQADAASSLARAQCRCKRFRAGFCGKIPEIPAKK